MPKYYEENPFVDYGLNWVSDFGQKFSDGYDENDEVYAHTEYYNKLPEMIRAMDPSMKDVKRVDRGELDMILNFMGGYDMAARDPDNIDKTARLAKAYQFGDYGSRPHDAIGDYWENMAGIHAYTPDTGRMSDQELYNLAKEYAQLRIKNGMGQKYDNVNIGDRIDPLAYEYLVDKPFGALIDYMEKSRGIK